MDDPNLYLILQVDPSADIEVIEAAYKRLARKYHPDIYSGTDANIRMMQLNVAKDTLSDPVQRRAYDAKYKRNGATSTPRDTGADSRDGANSGQLDQVIVSAAGTGDCRTISEAIVRVRSNGRIIVRPGIYREQITLNKPVRLVADGPFGHTVLESNNGICIYLSTGGCIIRGLTVRRYTNGSGDDGFAIATSHSFIAEDCDISSTSSSNLFITGSGAHPVIRRCRIHGSPRFGITVSRGAFATVEDSHIFGNNLGNIVAREGGNVAMRRCLVFNSMNAGVSLAQGSTGQIEGSSIYDNMTSGLDVGTNSSIDISRSSI
jgi:curved DNA-binding protein CbpA